jgi:type IV secretory pathway TraG/TraD family ATPase VirD4
MANSIQQVSVFEGNELHKSIPTFANQNAKVFIRGKSGEGTAFSIPITEDLQSKHMLFIGGIGMGKTSGIFQVISQRREQMTKNDVMMIFDTKGDFYSTFYQKGDIVISNDDKATGPDGPDYWNIFNEIDLACLEEDSIEIARSLFQKRSQQSNQPFFPNAARDIFTALLLHAGRTGDLRSNAKLRQFLDQSSAADIRALLQTHNDLKAISSYISDDHSSQTQGVISEFQQLMREIFVGNFRKEGTLSVRNAIRNKGGRIIFVEYDLGIGGMLTPIYSLLMDMAIKEALSRKKSDGNVWFVIDEFRLLPNLEHIDDGVNFGRSLGAKFIIGVQNIDQVFDSYGEAQARNILSGFLTTFAFRVNDATTRNYIQQMFGKNRKKEVYMASVQSRGIVEQLRDANVVEDWEITNLGIGEAIIGMPGLEPFKFKFDQYT